MSTTEAEFTAACLTTVETIWCKKFLLELLGDNMKKPKMYVDNQAAIQWIQNGLYEAKSKHIDIKYKFICERYREKVFDVK